MYIKRPRAGVVRPMRRPFIQAGGAPTYKKSCLIQ